MPRASPPEFAGEEEVRLKQAVQENLDDLDGGSVSSAHVDDIA